MISDLRSTDPASRPQAAAPVGPAEPASRVPASPDVAAGVSDERFDGIPASPPPEVLEQVEAGFARLQELREQGLELRYDVSDAARVRIELVDANGEVVRRVPPTEALEQAVERGPAASWPGVAHEDGTAGVDRQA